MWEQDGWDAKWRIGVLVPNGDVGPESELQAMAPGDVGIHAARVPFGAMRAGGAMDPTIPLAPVRDFAAPPYVDDAAELLAAAPLDAIAFGFTSSAYVLGADGEAKMLDRLAARTRGLRVVAPCASMTEALRLLGVQRLALFDPPWFDAELNALGGAYYRAAGFEIVSSRICDLPSNQSAIVPDDLFQYLHQRTPDAADGVLVGGNGFRSVGVIAELERALGRPVVTANQALLWAAMRAAGAPTGAVTAYGRVFALA
jgi:maleate isomerase